MLQREGALNALLKVIVDVYEEVHAGESFNFVYGGSGLLHRLLGIGVGVIEADGFFLALAHREYYLEETLGDGNL